MDLQALRNELDAGHPVTGAYSADNETAANQLNTVNRPSERVVVPSWEILEATVPAEWSGLSNAEKQRYQTIVSAGQVNLKGANTRAALAAMFAAGSTTRTNLLALQAGPLQSRAAELGFGLVTPSAVANARRLP